jgi:type I restriction enzyme S subunit
MGVDRHVVSLGDICTGIYDGPHATPPPSDSGPIFLRIENITRSGRLDFSDLRRINDADFGHWTRRVKPMADDVVFSYEANLGLFARIPAGFHGCLGRRLALMRPNLERVDAGYLLFACLSPEFQEMLRQRTVLGSTVDRISLREFPSFKIPLPPLPEQKRIAHVLGTLDDKIELNRRMNATLDSLSRALFKSWFVDFDPVRQKAAGKQPVGMDAQTAALFPDSFEDSEIGEVPQGWDVVPLTEIVEVNPSRSLRKGEIAQYLDMANMPTSGHTPDALVARPFGSGTKFTNGDTLVARITPCLENGKTAFIDCLRPHEVAWGSTEFIVLRPNRPLPPEYAYCLGRDDGFREFAIKSMTGSSGRQRVPAESLFHFRVVRPPAGLAASFGDRVQQCFQRIRAAADESRTLAALRDTLLPKLLSGGIRVPDAEKAVEEATA